MNFRAATPSSAGRGSDDTLGRVTASARRSPGWWLQFLGVAHAAVGAVVYREALGDIAGDKVVSTVPDHGEKATAFWFMTMAPTLWLGGRLLRSAESTGDIPAQRVAGTVLAATGALGSVAMPAVSGFWAVTAVGLAALRRTRWTRPARSARQS